jgi:hypothetical protein
LRRFIIIGTAVAVLAGAAVAFAGALNNYTAGFKFSTSKPGSTKAPVALGFTQTLGAANATASKVAAPLVNIKTTIYGLVANAKDFPTCSSTKIDTGPKFDAACPKGAEVASGTVSALLGGPALDPSKTISCKPGLDVWNGGGKTLWFFFTAASLTQCGGLQTGKTAPYPGTVSQSGKNLVVNIPLPPDVSTKVANTPNFYGSLINETVAWRKLTTKVKGKTVGFLESVACKGGKRPWSVKYTAVPVAGAAGVSSTVTGSSKC